MITLFNSYKKLMRDCDYKERGDQQPLLKKTGRNRKAIRVGKLKNENMKKPTFLILVLIAISFAHFSTSCSDSKKNSDKDYIIVAKTPEDVVKHGEYLVTIMGCNDCHSPKRMGAMALKLFPN